MHPGDGPATLWAGPVELRPAEHLVRVDGRVLLLTRREYDLLCELIAHADSIVTREQLYARIWSRPMREGDRSVDVYVGRLRAKLAAQLPEWEFIHTHVGFGYRLAPAVSHDLHNGATGR
jgi:DNA-binding response OmpR family regulator